MARKEYTQTVRPASRIAERIFGWLAWISLLAVAGFTLYFSFVSVDDPRLIENVESAAEQVSQSEGMQDISPEQLTNAMLNFFNQVWLVALYLVLPLILGLFGLLTMRRRILSGFLLLFSGVLTAPLVLLFITGLIPLFFIIASILLFVRKDTIVRDEDLDRREVKKMRKENDKLEKEREREGKRARETEKEIENDDVKTYSRKENERDQSLSREDSSDIESTRKFTRVDDDEIKNYEESKPQSDDNDLTPQYDYEDNDAASERRSNVDRRNNDH